MIPLGLALGLGCAGLRYTLVRAYRLPKHIIFDNQAREIHLHDDNGEAQRLPYTACRGLVLAPDGSSKCNCSYQMRAWFALRQKPLTKAE